MRIEDLMINDWVFNTHNNKPEQVQEILTVSNCDNGNSVMLDYNDIYNEDDIEPIKLTPEILEKNGFKKEIDEDKIHNIYTLTENSTSLGIVYARSVFQWFYPIDIKYVHKLQHIMRLCGIDKQIIL